MVNSVTLTPSLEESTDIRLLISPVLLRLMVAALITRLLEYTAVTTAERRFMPLR